MAIRPIFRPGDKFVAVRTIRLSADTTVNAGDSVDHLREYHKRSLWQRRLIGPAVHPWTLGLIAANGHTVPANAATEQSVEPEAEPLAADVAGEEITRKRGRPPKNG